MALKANSNHGLMTGKEIFGAIMGLIFFAGALAMFGAGGVFIWSLEIPTPAKVAILGCLSMVFVIFVGFLDAISEAKKALK